MEISLDNFQWVEFKQREITIQRENKIALFELVSPQDSALYQIDYKQYCQRLFGVEPKTGPGGKSNCTFSMDCENKLKLKKSSNSVVNLFMVKIFQFI